MKKWMPSAKPVSDTHSNKADSSTLFVYFEYGSGRVESLSCFIAVCVSVEEI